jgi:hypothetical protein
MHCTFRPIVPLTIIATTRQIGEGQIPAQSEAFLPHQLYQSAHSLNVFDTFVSPVPLVFQPTLWLMLRRAYSASSFS